MRLRRITGRRTSAKMHEALHGISSDQYLRFFQGGITFLIHIQYTYILYYTRNMYCIVYKVERICMINVTVLSRI